MLALSQILDLLGVEEKQVSDPAGDIAINILVPMFTEQRVELCITRDLEMILYALCGLPPRAGHTVVTHLAVHRAAKAQFNRRTVCGVSPTVNHLPQIISVA